MDGSWNGDMVGSGSIIPNIVSDVCGEMGPIKDDGSQEQNDVEAVYQPTNAGKLKQEREREREQFEQETTDKTLEAVVKRTKKCQKQMRHVSGQIRPPCLSIRTPHDTLLRHVAETWFCPRLWNKCV
jgi:hypothetical protein